MLQCGLNLAFCANTDCKSVLLGERDHSCDISRGIDLDMAIIAYPCFLFSKVYKSVISRQPYHDYAGSHFTCMLFTDPSFIMLENGKSQICDFMILVNDWYAHVSYDIMFTPHT